MSQTVTLRLPDATAEWLKTSARRAGRSVSELGALLFEEARRMSEFAEIEFRSFAGERHACLKGGLRLWKIIMVAQEYDMNLEKTAAHFGLPTWKIQAAFHYYAAYPQEIDMAIADVRSMNYDRLKRLLPNLELQEVKLSSEEAEA